MAKAQKTTAAPLVAEAWLAGLEPPERRAEAARLLDIYAGATGFSAQLWGGAMVGFGRYVYRYDSGHGGESLACGFAPRKAELVLYGLPGEGAADALFARLGKHRRGKGCVYLKRLEGVDEAALTALIGAGLDELASRWTVLPD
jgi:hypothetical protein